MMRFLGASIGFLIISGNIPIASAQTLTFCEGELKEQSGKCGQHDVFVNCTEINNRATQVCSELGAKGKPQIVKLRDTSGNKCGYTVFRVTCQ